jgi:hypothetical protein
MFHHMLHQLLYKLFVFLAHCATRHTSNETKHSRTSSSSSSLLPTHYNYVQSEKAHCVVVVLAMYIYPACNAWSPDRHAAAPVL